MALTASEQFSGGFVRDADGREVVTFTLSGSAYDAAVLTDSPVAYWLLNDPSGTSALDASGNGHVGTYTGTYTLAQSGPCTDGEKAVAFNVGYVTVPHAASLAIIADITIEGWVNMPSVPAYAWMICKDVGAASSAYNFAMHYGALNPVLVRSGNASNPEATSGVTLGAWTHVAVTGAGAGTVTYYINGVAAGVFSSVYATNADDGGPVFLGTRGDLYAPFVGSMAKVAVYNTALSGARIAAHYAAR